MSGPGGGLRARADLDEHLTIVRREVSDIAGLVDLAIQRSVDSLARLDPELAETVIAEDASINSIRFAIEDDVIEIMATQQPIARDLRFCVSALNVSSELERIGDYAAGIARVTLLHGDQRLLKPLIDIPRMTAVVRDMLRSAVAAFLEGDARRAEAIAARDDEVDTLYDQVYRELLTYVMADRAHMERATWLLWVAHNLERCGDRVQNICERTIYEATGVMKEFTNPDA